MKDIKDYKGKKYAIQCKTQEEWDKITELLGYKWNKNNWELQKKESCINISGEGATGKSSYVNAGYEILQASDFLQPQFEADKWYKMLNPPSSSHYVKNWFNNDGLDGFEETISFGSYNVSGGNYGRIGSYKYELLTDLSEIQQFLPSGHPDKLPTFKFNIGDIVNGKEGGWQFCNPESKDALKSIKSIKFSFNDIVVNRKYTNNTNWYKLSDGGNWITEEGLELVEKENSVIPEYVECISTKSNCNDYNVGKIYKVENDSVITDSGYLPCAKLSKDLLNYYDVYDFKPSTKEAYENQQLMNKHNLVVGKYYTFKSGSGITYWFRFKEIKNSHLYSSGFRDDYYNNNWKEKESNLIFIENLTFKEVTEQEAKGIVEKEENQYKVGGWVKVISSSYGTNPYKIGGYYQIVSISSNGNLFLITEEHPQGLCMYPSECEWVGMNKPEEKWIPKVGEWVYILGVRHAENNNYFPKGKVFKISRINDDCIYVDITDNPCKIEGTATEITACRKALPHEIPNNQPKVDDNTQTIQYNPETKCIMYKGRDLTQNYTHFNWDLSKDNTFEWKPLPNLRSNTPTTITIKNRTKKEEKPLTKTRTKLTILKPKSITI